MGRIFEKRKERMFARWSKTAKAFTKLGKEIAIAVKLGGADPASNPRLRMAIQTARSLNMPKDRIEAAIHRASSKDASDLTELSYEGFAPHGVALFVEAATDNPTRTVANVRNIITRHGGNLGPSGSLDFIFERKGVFSVKPPEGDMDELELTLIDHGLEEIYETDEGLLLYSSFQDYGELQKALEAHNVEVLSAAPQRIPLSTVTVTPAQEEEIQKIIEKLDDDDDVQNVFHNMKTEGE